MSKKPTATNNAKLIENSSSPFHQLLICCKKYKDLRVASLSTAREIVNLRNRSTFVSNAKVSQALGGAVKPSRLLVQFSAAFDGHCRRLNETQEEMLKCLEIVVSLHQDYERESITDVSVSLSSSSPSSPSIVSTPKKKAAGEWAVDSDFIADLITQMQQQTLLEMCITESLTTTTGGGGGEHFALDQDAAITMLACFTHPPYLKPSALETLLEFE